MQGKDIFSKMFIIKLQWQNDQQTIVQYRGLLMYIKVYENVIWPFSLMFIQSFT